MVCCFPSESDLGQDIEALEYEFSELASSLMQQVMECDVRDLLARIATLPPSIHRHSLASLKILQRCTTLEDLFVFLTAEVWSFLDCYILGYLIDIYGNRELKYRKNEYVANLCNFKQITLVVPFIEWWKIHRGSIPIEKRIFLEYMELEYMQTDLTLEMLDHIRPNLHESFIPPLFDYATYYYEFQRESRHGVHGPRKSERGDHGPRKSEHRVLHGPRKSEYGVHEPQMKSGKHFIAPPPIPKQSNSFLCVLLMYLLW